MPLSDAQYKKLFVDAGLVTDADYARAKEAAAATGEPLETALVGIGVFNDEQVGKLVADAFGVNFVNLKRVTVDADAARLLPDLVVQRQGAFAFGYKDGKLLVAMTDPENVELLGDLERKTGFPTARLYTTPNLLKDAVASFGENAVSRMAALIDRVEKLGAKGGKGAETAVEDDAMVQFVDLFLNYASANGASDVHVEPSEKTSVLRYRVDGVLHDVISFPKVLHDKVVSRVKILSNLRTDEHFGAQDGKFRAKFEGDTFNIRVSIVPVVDGEKIVMRLLSDKGRAFTLETLGLERRDLEKVRAASERPYGMLLATGPTGSGKTTTMYAVLKLLNSREVNIQTIEDPVEYDLDGVNQIQVNERTGLTFASGLRSIVRQDPDIIMVGEIRDSETAGIAVNAAMTGHLVLSTLHTNDAATSLPRLLDMKVEPFLVASSVNVIIAQRLVRKICSTCITSERVDAAKLKRAVPPRLYAEYFAGAKGARLYKGKGCDTCKRTGYVGRVGIFEVMEVTDAIRDLIVRETDAATLAAEAVKEGMTTMFEDGVRKVLAGVTTLDEVLRVAAQ